MTEPSKRGRINSDTQSVGELLRNPYFFTVPDYQRDFAWTTEEIDELWFDITSALSKQTEEYFLGAIVISQSQNPKYRDIVDGQQRMACLSMIFAGIRNAWKDILNAPLQAGQVGSLYLGNIDRASQKVIPKLTLNANNKTTFQNIVLNSEKPTKKSKKLKSDKLLEEAFKRIESHVSKYLEHLDEKSDGLVQLEDYVAEKVQMIIIETLDDSDAFIIFETLNDRGMDLAVADLVKNYIFSNAGQNLKEFKEYWKNIVSEVGAENITSFLRHVWLSEKTIIREKELYKSIRREYSTPLKSASYIKKLLKYSYYFNAIKEESSEYWGDYDTKTKENIRALNRFKLTQFIPMLMAAMDTEDKIFVSAIVEVLTIVSFRYTVISMLGTGNLEKTYNDAALKIQKLGCESLSSVYSLLKKMYVEDEIFKNNFAERDFTKNDIPRYILIAINNSMIEDKTLSVNEFGDITLEHIAPKKANSDWALTISSVGVKTYQGWAGRGISRGGIE